MSLIARVTDALKDGCEASTQAVTEWITAHHGYVPARSHVEHSLTRLGKAPAPKAGVAKAAPTERAGVKTPGQKKEGGEKPGGK